MKKRVGIPANAMDRMANGVAFLLDGKSVVQIFSGHEQIHVRVFGVEEPLKLRRIGVHERLNYVFLDFSQHDFLHRAAVEYGSSDWDHVDALLRPLCEEKSIEFIRQR